ncbi:MAG: hypothetical protein ACOVP4_03145 [Bacteriovoracaceae bacterium]
MDKKKLVKSAPPEDLKGFEEFIESQSNDTSFLLKNPPAKKEVSFEYFTFLTNDAYRLKKINQLVSEKLPFMRHHEQGLTLLSRQQEEVERVRRSVVSLLKSPTSSFHLSLRDIFDSFFAKEEKKD